MRLRLVSSLQLFPSASPSPFLGGVTLCVHVVSRAPKVCHFIARVDPFRMTGSVTFEFPTLLFYAFCLILFSMLFLIVSPSFVVFLTYFLSQCGYFKF